MPDAERLRFIDWMARALHDPERGYYAKQVRTVGRRGDFSTSASAGTVLGEAVAHWVAQELPRGERGVRTVIEIGGGDGALSAAARRAMGWWKRRGLRWFMVETSKPLRAQQEGRLGTKDVRWFTDLTEALRACDGRALIFHNELLDAFPVDLMRWDAGNERWQEVWVIGERGAWRESCEPVAVLPGECSAVEPGRWQGMPLRDGQRIEIGTACREWLRSLAPHWKAGAMLTIDYGDTFPQIYHRQPGGTLRAYFMHQRLMGSQVYENMGRQDITADVNFTDVMAWGEMLGWKTGAFATQREFLVEHVREVERRAAGDPAVAFLLSEQGAGAAFKVLIQRPA
jgi:SAM-dependent MidA family methyltransferase